ncbi:MAG: DUF4154 domain-containing protein [Ignavibacteriales bacterium]|nr:DUF4154 domain-containing protein [Ignavibacteriales bacterium]
MKYLLQKYQQKVSPLNTQLSISLFYFLVFLYSGYLYPQQFQREEVISSYIYNFALNIEWRNEDRIKEFHFCIIGGNKKIIEELNKICSIKRIRNKPIKLTINDRLTNIDDAQLIFVTKDKEELLEECFDKIEGKNILLISDNYYTKKIVMINFYVTNDQRLKFEINKANIINQGLTILPDMVLMGGSEIDVAALYRESQISLRTLQKQLDVLQQREQQLAIKIESSTLEIIRQEKLINSQSASIDSQKVQLNEQKHELHNLLLAIELKQDTLKQQTNIIAEREKELNEQKVEIDKREKVLTAQKVKIDNQNIEIEKQAKSLKKQDVTISTQQNFLYLLLAIAFLGIGLFFAIYIGYKNKRRINARLTEEIEERKKVEEALGKSEDLYNHAPCGYHSLDKNGVFVRMNNTELEWLGYRSEEIVGRLKFVDLVTDNSKKVFEENFPRFKASGAIRDIEFELICKDKTIKNVLLSGTAIYDEDGNFLMSRSTLYDITERKQAEEELRESDSRVRAQLNAILAPDGDIGGLDLADIAEIKTVQAIMDYFSKFMNIAVAIVDLKGKVLVAAGWQDICTKYHRVHPDTCAFCTESDLELSQGVEPGNYKIYKCKTTCGIWPPR